MRYDWKLLPELYWGVAIAASLVLLQALVTFDPEAITDWRVWGVALGATIRAAAGAAIDWIRRSMTTEAASAEETAPVPQTVVTPDLVSALADALEARRVERVAAYKAAQNTTRSGTTTVPSTFITRDHPAWLPPEQRL